MTRAVWVRIVLLSLLWGGSFLCMKLAVRELPPLTIVFLRTALGACTLLLLLATLRPVVPWSGAVWRNCLAMGALNNLIPFSCIIWAQQWIGMGLGAVVNAATPLLTVLLAHALTAEEHLTRTRIAGTGLGLVGVAVLVSPVVTAPAAGGTRLAIGAACLAALSQALAAIKGRSFRRLGIPPLAAAAGQIAAAALLVLPLALLLERPWTLPMPSGGTLLVVAVLGLACTGLAFVLFFSILERAGAGASSIAMMLVPVNAMLLGALVFRERLLPVQWLGAAMVGLGLLVLAGRARWPLSPKLLPSSMRRGRP
ncbi:DMT family transporter [Roseomonas sp. OT10]|uniref:DMT family transporter n=1 Tax=Roseomonas cutis TaxID=2897332 RepID=UPI001E3D4963|nr:DMT family transporter [Roseomonas sp. OT10]UFN48508.1 DMT family transporter [Roseomonas sp. OT10]